MIRREILAGFTKRIKTAGWMGDLDGLGRKAWPLTTSSAPDRKKMSVPTVAPAGPRPTNNWSHPGAGRLPGVPGGRRRLGTRDRPVSLAPASDDLTRIESLATLFGRRRLWGLHAGRFRWTVCGVRPFVRRAVLDCGPCSVHTIPFLACSSGSPGTGRNAMPSAHDL
jgi:hypothetical protein